MPKTAVQLQFDHLVKQLLWPLFKERGYQKTGANFRYYDPEGWGKILNIQKGQFSNHKSIRFTLNTGLYLPETERLWLRSGKIAGEKFLEPDCLIRKRIGDLKDSQQDSWYELEEQREPAILLHRVQQDVRDYVLPYFDRIQGLDDILQQLQQERYPNSILAIKTLFAYGYRQPAREWVEHELATTIYRRQREEMQALQVELEALG